MAERDTAHKGISCRWLDASRQPSARNPFVKRQLHCQSCLFASPPLFICLHHVLGLHRATSPLATTTNEDDGDEREHGNEQRKPEGVIHRQHVCLQLQLFNHHLHRRLHC